MLVLQCAVAMCCCFRALNLKILIEKKTAVTHLPGFKYDDFDRAGILGLFVLFVTSANYVDGGIVLVRVYWFVFLLSGW